MKPLTDEILFISDLHLSSARPATTDRFVRFIKGRASTAGCLYILGDLFDAYLGDDDLAAPNDRVRHALGQLTAGGTRVAFQPGNRDFLLGSAFARATGVSLLDDYHTVEAYGQRVLLMHGDLLCTDDVQYQAARCRVRTPAWREYALGKPLWLRRLHARWYRLKSRLDQRGKSGAIMDVNLDTVETTLQTHAVSILIHGHTHRPGLNQPVASPARTRRIVLPEWDGQEQVLCWTAEGFRMTALAVESPP